MKIKNIVTFLLLLSISFSVVHAYAIEILDTEESHLSGYILESSHTDTKHDDKVCDIHNAFHTVFILPTNIILKKDISASQNPIFRPKNYTYNSLQNLLKPPKI